MLFRWRQTKETGVHIDHTCLRCILMKDRYQRAYLHNPKQYSPSNNRSLDCALCEAVATFDQFFQPLGEACCRSSIDKGVIEAQGYAKVFTDDGLPIGDTRFRSYAAQGKING